MNPPRFQNSCRHAGLLGFRRVGMFALGMLSGTWTGFADGKAHPPATVSTEVTMPDQRALPMVYFSDLLQEQVYRLGNFRAKGR